MRPHLPLQSLSRRVNDSRVSHAEPAYFFVVEDSAEFDDAVKTSRSSIFRADKPSMQPMPPPDQIFPVPLHS